MPAPRTKPTTRTTLALTLLVGCASNRSEPPPSAAAPARVEASLDEYAPPAPVAPGDAIDQLEASLAAYEQQLADKESRLRAMGVRIAAAAPAGPKAESEDRFAPPPSPRPSDAMGDDDTPRERQVTSKDKGKKSPTKNATTAPAPEPTTPGGRAASYKSALGGAASEEKADGASNRCDELCDLAHATCDLEAKICDLAGRHAGEPRYAEVCTRAGDDCRAASEACNLCSP